MTSSQDVPQQTVRPGAEQEVLSSSPETTDLMDVNVSNNSEQDLESQNQPLLNDKPEGSTIHETDVNENECLILPRVALTDLALGEEIARGTFGKVRRAQWLGTDVAVKETDVKRMKFTKPIIIQELKIHSKIRHPNIIQLMAYTTEKNKLYMILELNDGKNLEEVIFDDHEGIIPLDIKMEITRSVIKAVAYLHNQSPPIIHMDIKPENVLVSRELKRIRLCNLGISKLKTMNSSISTSMGSLQPGTLAYQAPEVFMNQSSATSYSDIWSTGCTILELFTEMPAWSIPPDDDLGAYILTRMKDCHPPDAMQAFLSIFPENCKFKEIIRMALSYDAKNRPSALELLSNCCL
ncbi:hypothetical protein FSP39_023122 [Pinctada imbricata]|uniref:Protein kinase domain-containing protein n=1 Tax=Pinctada imbricata TaxID=66713 RepID=A0AA89BXY2_PINIB|nr:hypothetical protein FSP39_023122 [Pinctada imbricata]